MGKVIYTAAMSLDGFIAGPGGDMSWMRPFMGPNPEVDLMMVVPVLLGDGTPMFRRPEDGEVRLEQIRASEAPTGVNLWYRVER